MESRTSNQARGRTATWRPGVGAPAWVWPESLGGFAGGAARRLAAWVIADVGPGRLTPWLAVSFGLGIVLYFAADQEPALWAALALALSAFAAAVLVRHRPIGFPLMVAAAAIAAGFATATVKRLIVAHPVLPAVAWNVEITGFVEVREERERSDRIVVRVHHIEGPRLEEKLERVRVSVRKGTAPAVGGFVTFKARLTPPLEPLMPGGYEFARAMYFQGIGASGFALGAIRTAPPPTAADASLRYAMVIDGMRDTIDKRIRAVLTGDQAAIASALITGKRDAISASVNDAMFISGIGHVLSISGYHVFLVIRSRRWRLRSWTQCRSVLTETTSLAVTVAGASAGSPIPQSR